jgi:hypothetical protein
MSMLRNLEARLEGLVAGTFNRAFKSTVQPVELAHKLAKEMEVNKTASLSNTYVPNHYRVFLSPGDREQFASYEDSLRKELSDYLLDHARSEGLALTSRPAVDLLTDDRLALGEFGIQAQLLGDEPEIEEVEPQASEPAASADFGHTMVYSPDREARRLDGEDEVAPAAGHAARALLVGEGKRTVLSGSRVVIGRSRECDAVLDDANVSRRHAEVRQENGGWVVADLGSTNGIKVNGRRVEQARLEPGDELRVGVTDLTFELE